MASRRCHAAGKSAYNVIGPVPKTHQLQHLGNARVRIGHSVESAAAKLQILSRRHFVVKRGLLRQHADASTKASSRGSDIFTQDAHGPAGRPDQAADHVDQRRLARAVRSDNSHHLADLHAEGKSVDSAHAAKAAPHVGDFDGSRGGPEPVLELPRLHPPQQPARLRSLLGSPAGSPVGSRGRSSRRLLHREVSSQVNSVGFAQSHGPSTGLHGNRTGIIARRDPIRRRWTRPADQDQSIGRNPFASLLPGFHRPLDPSRDGFAVGHLGTGVNDSSLPSRPISKSPLPRSSLLLRFVSRCCHSP